MSPRCGFLCLSPSNLVCTPHPQPGGLQSSGSSPPRPPRVPRGAGRPPSPSQPLGKDSQDRAGWSLGSNTGAVFTQKWAEFSVLRFLSPCHRVL